MKRCSTCGELKLLCNFAKKKNARDGHHVKCKACQQEYWKEYREKNRDRLNAKDKEYRKSNKEELKKYRESNKEKMKEYYVKNKEKLKEYKKEYYAKNKESNSKRWKEYYAKNKEKLKEYSNGYRKSNKEKISAYGKNRRDTNSLFKLTVAIRTMICSSLRKRGYKKSSRTHEILGCSFEEFYTHIEGLFLEGMNWENRGEWHLDHIVPVSFGESEEEIILLNHYSNLRPLWGKDNLEKSGRLVEESINHPIYHEILKSREK